jgi:hypothetical protein
MGTQKKVKKFKPESDSTTKHSKTKKRVDHAGKHYLDIVKYDKDSLLGR